MQKGFSLVELAIVLVIIGLITGGILTGQDLIRASELNSIYADVNKFKTAFNTFKLKYNAMPGDMSNATSYWGAETCPGSASATGATGTCNGDADGIIDYIDWTTISGNESYRVWEHLSLAGLIPGSYTGLPATGVSTTAGVAGVSLPGSRSNSVFAMVTITAGSYLSSVFYNLYGNMIGNYRADFTTSLTPPELNSLDAKYDDGRPGYGAISAQNSTVSTGCTSTDVASTAAYILTTTTATCWAYFWIK